MTQSECTAEPGPHGLVAHEPVAALAGACVRFGTIEALHAITLTVPRGAIVTIIGPNGSGKSTLLGLLSGLVRPSSGEVQVLGCPPGRSGGRVAHVLQSTAIREEVPMTVLETVRLGTYPRLGMLRRGGARTRGAIDEVLQRMRIVDLAHRPLHELSGGQRQRTFIAQGLVQDADLLLLDEPVNGLDVPSREIITEVVREEADRGRSVVVSTHDIGAAASADLVALVATRLVAFGPPSDVLKPEPLLVAYGNQASGSLWSGGLDPGAIGSEIVAELLPRSVPS